MAEDITYWRCSACDGHGITWFGHHCHACAGTGNALSRKPWLEEHQRRKKAAGRTTLETADDQ